ncbi:MAG: hypothetical protein JW728_05385 [Candidatus Aureabacteria bacterium]|nr:hypothetical protein [Candidatus Auribacterota bacterium]
MKVLLTGGPTREYIDAVRCITNRSSGKMAKALIGALLKNRHKVTAVLGPCGIECPKNVKVIGVETAGEMRKHVIKEAARADAVVMCAAVADYAPVRMSAGKIKKRGGFLTLKLKETPDILAELGGKYGENKIIVGFAAETGKVEENALKKLKNKKCDMIIANKVGRKGPGFDSGMIDAVILFKDGRKNRIGKISKNRLGYIIVKEIEKLNEA